jgi:hypothetical protein
MRGPILVLVLVAGAALAASVSSTTLAQDVDGGECQQVCYEQQQVCVTACGEHGNPVECEAQCNDDLSACLEECR